MEKIELEQLINIVSFCALMQNNEGILNKSPDYILEKFNRYAINKEIHLWGLDKERQTLVSEWILKWARLNPDLSKILEKNLINKVDGK